MANYLILLHLTLPNSRRSRGDTVSPQALPGPGIWSFQGVPLYSPERYLRIMENL